MSDEHLAVFEQHRPMLQAVAYRMLGSRTEAEDIIQESFFRWQKTTPDTVESPPRFLTTVVTRLCIDVLRSARVQREEYVGTWLPEPVRAEGEIAGVDPLCLSESLSMALLLVLEQLSPMERAAWLLHEVFDYEFTEIASILGKSPANCRQMGRRARLHLRASGPRYQAQPALHMEVVRQFQSALKRGDVEGLVGCLTEDASFFSDGGTDTTKVQGVSAIRRPLHGASRIADFLSAVFRRFDQALDSELVWLNQQPGALSYHQGTLQSATLFQLEDDKICNIYVITAPEKLAALQTIHLDLH